MSQPACQSVAQPSAQRLTLLLLYSYCVGIVSSRRIERACYEDLAFRVLTSYQQSDYR
jgi:transposase